MLLIILFVGENMHKKNHLPNKTIDIARTVSKAARMGFAAAIFVELSCSAINPPPPKIAANPTVEQQMPVEWARKTPQPEPALTASITSPRKPPIFFDSNNLTQVINDGLRDKQDKGRKRDAAFLLDLYARNNPAMVKPVVPAALDALMDRSTDTETRKYIIRSLGKIGDPVALSVLMKVRENDLDNSVRKEADIAIKAIKGE